MTQIYIINLSKDPLMVFKIQPGQKEGKIFYIRSDRRSFLQLSTPLVKSLNYIERLAVGTSTGVISFFLVLNDQGNIDLIKRKYEEGKLTKEIILSFALKDYVKPSIYLRFKKKGRIRAKIIDDVDSDSDSDD